MAAAYQRTRSPSSSTTTGSSRPCTARRHRPPPPGAATESIAIRLAGAQSFAHPMRHRQELGRVAEVQAALARKVVVDDLDDTPRARAHHHDAGRKKYRLGDRMGDEDHGL